MKQDASIIPAFYGRIAVICGIISVLSGLIVLGGWAWNIPELTYLIPGTVSMKPNTALSLFLCGLSLIVLSYKPLAFHSARPAQILGGMVVLIAGLTLIEMVADINMGIDELMFKEMPNPIATAVPGRMAPITAVSLLAVGLSLICVDYKSRSVFHPFELLASLPLLLGAISVLEYLLNSPLLYNFNYYTHMAVPTAVTFIVLSAGILCLRPAQGFIGALRNNKIERSDGLIYAAVATFYVALIFGGGWFYRTQESALVAKIEANLDSIAQLKSHQISQWRFERLGDAGMVSGSGIYARMVQDLFEKPALAKERMLMESFKALGKNYNYHDVMLLDRQGRVRLSLSGLKEDLHQEMISTLDAAFMEHRAVMSELHFLHNDTAPHVDIIAPLFSGSGPSAKPVGAIILRQLAKEFLYPMISDWPTPTETAETILCKRDGDTVLYLNELRHQQHTALRYRFPLTNTRFPAVMGALGKTGIFNGIDYRGVKVLAALRPISGTNWFIVSKMDEEEALEEWRFRSKLILSIGLLLAAGFLISFVMVMALKRTNCALAASEEEVRRFNLVLEEKVQTRTKELEESVRSLENANKELEHFAYIASHDLQEPLRMVSSFTQLLGQQYKGKLDADADEYIHYAVDGAKRMQKLIQDLLSYSRVTTRGKPFEAVELDRVMDIICNILQLQIEENQATVRHEPLPVVMADMTQMTQLMQNLISNAIKFRREEPPEICVRAGREGDYWKISVSDNGIGIEPQYYERIFQMFQRLHSRERFDGTGIGLAICRKIVERHGGSIWVESVMDKGTTFCFTLPYVDQEKMKLTVGENLKEN